MHVGSDTARWYVSLRANANDSSMSRRMASGNAWRKPASQTKLRDTISKAFSRSVSVDADDSRSAVAASSRRAWCQTAPSDERPCVAQSYFRALSLIHFCTIGFRARSHTRTIVGRTPIGRRPPSDFRIKWMSAVATAVGQYPVSST